MKFQRRFEQQAVIANSSMSDIAFLLLIFFMVTTAFAARKGIDFRLPGDTGGTAKEVPAILIDVSETGSLQINEAPCDLSDIRRVVLPTINDHPDQPVIIRVADNAFYGNMIDVLDELKQIGVKNIALPE